MGHRVTRLRERAISGIVRYQGRPVVEWMAEKRCWVVVRVVSKRGTTEKGRFDDDVLPCSGGWRSRGDKEDCMSILRLWV